MHQSLVPDHFFIFANNRKQPLHAINSFKNKIFWKRIMKYPLKSWLDFFLSNPVLFNGQSYQKRGLELVTSCSSGYEISSQKFLYYKLSEQVWWGNVNWFLSYYKNYTWKFMQANSWHHKFFHVHSSFWIWKVRKRRGKLQKFEYFENKRSFLYEMKNIFNSSWKAIIW